MSNTVPAQHPAVVLRSSYRQLRALLATATIAIIGLTAAVVVLAINTGTSTPASPAATANQSVIRANPTAELGAKLNHRGVTTSSFQAPNTVNRAQQAGPNPDQAAAVSAVSSHPASGPNPDQATP